VGNSSAYVLAVFIIGQGAGAVTYGTESECAERMGTQAVLKLIK
jgi:uncharacterized membrane protein